jgi:hypothetical protein
VVDNASTFLFHRPEFIFRDPGSQILTFQNSAASIFFTKLGNSLISLDKAPFGSFHLESDATLLNIKDLLSEIEKSCADQGVVLLTIRSFPQLYSPKKSELIEKALREHRFVVRYNDVSQVVPISQEAMPLNVHKKRRVRKAAALGFHFIEIAEDNLTEAYTLFVESREQKGYPVSMTLEDLRAMFKRFRNEYLLFGVFDKQKMIAASVCIKINKKILYCFYIGDHLPYRSESPVTSLVAGIYEYCRTHNFELLDLGMSTDRGELNTGLYNFKRTFGSIDSPKLTFEKKL